MEIGSLSILGFLPPLLWENSRFATMSGLMEWKKQKSSFFMA
jgi:hypothetical protein